MFSGILLMFAFLFGLLSLATHAQQARLMLPIGHTANITSVAFSPDGLRIHRSEVMKTTQLKGNTQALPQLANEVIVWTESLKN